jgi:hypothetical protein
MYSKPKKKRKKKRKTILDLLQNINRQASQWWDAVYSCNLRNSYDASIGMSMLATYELADSIYMSRGLEFIDGISTSRRHSREPSKTLPKHISTSTEDSAKNIITRLKKTSFMVSGEKLRHNNVRWATTVKVTDTRRFGRHSSPRKWVCIFLGGGYVPVPEVKICLMATELRIRPPGSKK